MTQPTVSKQNHGRGGRNVLEWILPTIKALRILLTGVSRPSGRLKSACQKITRNEQNKVFNVKYSN